MLKKAIQIFALIFVITNSFAQKENSCQSSLSGQILDEHDKTALEFASIIIVEINAGVTSDINGNYTINNLCDGIYTVKISHVGCEPVEKKIKISGKTLINFYTEHHAELLKTIAIVGEKQKEQTTQTQNTVTEEKFNQAKGQSLGDALKSITGVNTLSTGSSISKPIIHGMHSNRVLILNNGIRQEGQQWGVEHAPEVDPFIANQVSVIKGANSVLYGSDAIAGVVLVESKPLRDSAGIGGELNLVGMSNGKGGTISGFTEGNFTRLKPFAWRLQGTLKQNGTLAAPNYNLINTGLKEYNFSYAMGWKKERYGAEVFYSQFNTTLGIFGASHIGNVSDLKKAFESPVPLETGAFTYVIGRPYQHIEHELFKVKSHVLTGEAGKLSLTYARQYNLRYEYDKHKPLNDSLAALNKPNLQFELTSHTLDAMWEHRSINNFSGSLGASGITQGNTYSGRALIPNFRNYSGGIFLMERWRHHNLELEGGLRYDYKWMQVFKYQYAGDGSYEMITPIHKFENVSSNFGVIYKKDSTLNLSLNIGSAWRAPSVNELYSFGLHHGAAAIEYGDNKLQKEQAYNSIFTIRYSPNKRFFAEISPYYNFIQNYIYRQPTASPIVTISGSFPGFNYRQTNAILKGLDAFVNCKLIQGMELTAKTSLLRAWNKKLDNWLIMMPTDRYEMEMTYRLKKRNRFNSGYISASAQYVTKQTRVPENSDFVAPPSAYFLANLHGACTITIYKQDIELGISVNNLFNHSYRDYLDRFRYFTDAMGRNVSLRIKIPFNMNFKSITKP